MARRPAPRRPPPARGPRPGPALAAHAAALVVWHLPAAYELALRQHPWHIVQHLVLLATAMLPWWPILSPSRVAPPLPYGTQLVYVFVLGMPMTVVAAMITAAERVLYPFYAEAPRALGLDAFTDQRLGGVIIWVPTGLVPLAALTAIFYRWVAAEWDPADAPAPGEGRAPAPSP